MSKANIVPDPAQFHLASFAELLFHREPLIGEDPGTNDGFHAAMIQSLGPATPHECVIADNLIVLEWELLQHRRMRDAGLRRFTAEVISEAFVASRKDAQKSKFNPKVAAAEGKNLANRAVASDPQIRHAAQAEITALGMDPIQVMSEAYRTASMGVTHHHFEIKDLEKRRREVKRDYDALQKTRPFDASLLDANVREEPIVEKVPTKPRKTKNWV
jgi:hypothetical protein